MNKALNEKKWYYAILLIPIQCLLDLSLVI